MYTLTLDMKKENKTKKIIIPEEGLVLVPGELYLGRTCETVHTDKLLTLLEGRSSLARLGITIHVSAGFIDTGYQGAIVLEIFCIRPVRIYPWVEIGQIYYSLIEGELMQYAGKYQNTKDIIPSMLYKDFQK
jgi:dCTP deaminase